MSNLSEILFNLTYIALSISISLVYWFKDANTGFKHIAVSIHSASILFLMGLSLLLGFSGFTHKLLLIPFYSLLLVSLFSVILSIRFFTGSKLLHLTHIWNLAAIVWTWIIGSMALTGDWL